MSLPWQIEAQNEDIYEKHLEPVIIMIIRY